MNNMDMEEMKKQKKAMEMVLDMLASTGDKRMIFAKETRKLTDKLYDLSLDRKITDEQFGTLTNAVKEVYNTIEKVFK